MLRTYRRLRRRRPEVVARLFAMADRAADRADYFCAIDSLQRAISTLRLLPQDRERDVWLSEALIRLGNQQRLTGHFSDAHAALTEACSRADANCLEPIRRGGVRNALGILAKDTGDLAGAERWYAEALDLFESDLGADSPKLASLQHNLAGLAHARRDYTTAETHARRALALRARTSGRLEELAGDLCVLGAVLAGQGRNDEAEIVLLDALGRWRRLYGPDHYEVAVVLHNLGGIESARGNQKAARAAFIQALTIKRAVLGDGHREVAVLVDKVAAIDSGGGQRGRF